MSPKVAHLTESHVPIHPQVGNESKTSNKLRTSKDSVGGELHEPSSLSSSTPEAQFPPSKNLKGGGLLSNQEGDSLDEGVLGSGAPRNLLAVCAPGFIDCENG